MEKELAAVILAILVAAITGHTINEYPEKVSAILLIDAIAILQFIKNCME